MADQHIARGPALDAAGNLADAPRDLMHRVNADLLDVIALLHAVRYDEGEVDEIHDGHSRACALTRMADQRLRDVLKAVEPYV